MFSHSSPPSQLISKNCACSAELGPRIKVGMGAAETMNTDNQRKKQSKYM